MLVHPPAKDDDNKNDVDTNDQSITSNNNVNLSEHGNVGVKKKEASGGEGKCTKIGTVLLAFIIIVGTFIGIVYGLNMLFNVVGGLYDCQKNADYAINFFSEKMNLEVYDKCRLYGIPMLNLRTPIPIANLSYLLLLVIVLFILSWRYYYKYIWTCCKQKKPVFDNISKASNKVDDLVFSDYHKKITNDKFIDHWCEDIMYVPPIYKKWWRNQYRKHADFESFAKNINPIIKQHSTDKLFWDSKEDFVEEKIKVLFESKKFRQVLETELKDGEINTEIMTLCQQNIPGWEKYSVENRDFKVHNFSEGVEQAYGMKYLKKVECIPVNKNVNTNVPKFVVVEGNHRRGYWYTNNGEGMAHELECHVLKLLEKHGIHPKIYHYGKKYRIVEFVQGKILYKLGEISGLGLVKVFYLQMMPHVWFLKYILVFFKSTCCRMSTKDETSIVCPETLNRLGKTIGRVHKVPIDTVYKEIYGEEYYTNELAVPAKVGIDKNGKIRYTKGYGVCGDFLNGTDPAGLKWWMFRNSFNPLFLGGIGGISQVSFLYLVYIIIALINNRSNLGSFITEDNSFSVILFIWIHNLYVMWNLGKKITKLTFKLNEKKARRDGIWGKPVFIHFDMHGSNIVRPDDPNVSMKVVDWVGWRFGLRSDDIGYCFLMTYLFNIVPSDKALENARRAFAKGYLSQINDVSNAAEISDVEIEEFLWNLELSMPASFLRVGTHVMCNLMGPNWGVYFINLAERAYYVTQSENRNPTSLKKKLIKYGALNVLYHGIYYPFHFFQGYY